jgi:hypothetical protein
MFIILSISSELTSQHRSCIYRTLDLLDYWCPLSDSVLLISTTRSPSQLKRELSECIYYQHAFSVCEFDCARVATLPSHAQRWLEHVADTAA